MIRVEPITTYTADAREVAQNMRREDREELWALGRSLPEDAVTQSIEMSTEAYVVFSAQTPIAVMGANTPALGDVSVPWLLGTRGVDAHASEYMRLGRKFTAHLLEKSALLENLALSTNRRTLVFLSRMGFAIGEPFKVPTGAEAVRFTMEK